MLYMKYAKLLTFLFFINVSFAQDFELPALDLNTLSPTVQSPLYQSLEIDDFYLLVEDVNIYKAPVKGDSFNFIEASARKEERQSYQQFFAAVERQMAQYANFKVEINNSKSSALIDYNDQPIYSGSNRVHNAVYRRADRLIGTQRPRPFFLAPSLSARRGFIWY
jgi:hypothetical protein